VEGDSGGSQGEADGAAPWLQPCEQQAGRDQCRALDDIEAATQPALRADRQRARSLGEVPA